MDVTRLFRVIAVAFASIFGVYSVSPSSFAYSSRFGSGTSDSIKFSRSARDTAPAPRHQEPAYSAPRGPYAPGTHNISLGVGQYFLIGDLGNNYENTIGPEIHYTYGVSDLFAFESNFGYHSHSSGNLSIWNVAAGLRANLMYFDQLVPFTTVALGFYHPSYILPNNASVSSLLFGMQLGTGIDLLISNQVFFGARLTYNDMFSSSKKDSNGVNQSVGGSFISFMIQAGITY